MKPTDTDNDTISQVEGFLAGNDGGLLRRWALEGFRRGLPRAIEAEGLHLGASVKQRGNCLRFLIYYPPGRKPSTNGKLRTFVHTLLKRTGWRVRDRSLWFMECARRRALVVVAAPDWRGED